MNLDWLKSVWTGVKIYVISLVTVALVSIVLPYWISRTRGTDPASAPVLITPAQCRWTDEGVARVAAEAANGWEDAVKNVIVCESQLDECVKLHETQRQETR